MTEQLDQFELGRRIRTARESISMSRDDLADRVPMSRSFLADVEGGTKGISLKKFYRIAAILDVSADYLLETKHMDQGDKERVILMERIREDMEQCNIRTLEAIASVVREISQLPSAEEGTDD